MTFRFPESTLSFLHAAVLIGSLTATGCWTFRSLNESAPPRDGGTSDDGAVTRDDGGTMDRLGECSQPATPTLQEASWFPDADSPIFLGDLIAFTLLRSQPLTAELGWQEVENGARRDYRAPVDLYFDDPEPNIVVQEQLKTPFAVTEEYEPLSIAIGPTEDGQSDHWAVSGSECAVDMTATNVAWFGTGGMLETTIDSFESCPNVPRPWGIEYVGGYNPFTGASAIAPTLMYFEQVENPTISLLPHRSPGPEDHRSVPWDNKPEPDVAWIHSTRGELALVPEDTGNLWVWTVVHPIEDAPRPALRVDDPQRMVEIIEPLSVDFVALDGAGTDDSRYLLATLGDSEITLEVVHYNALIHRIEAIEALDTIAGLTEPVAVELATFDGGFVVFYYDAVSAGLRWTVQPYLHRPDADTLEEEFLHVETCFHESSEDEEPRVELLDLDVEAHRDAAALYVLGAVNERDPSVPARYTVDIKSVYWHDFFAE